MDLNLRKMWPAAAASLVAITSLLSAADDSQMRNLENRVTALEQKKGASGMINPSARPRVKDGADLFVTGEALLWKVHEDGLDYAIQKDDPTACVACPDTATLPNRLGTGDAYVEGKIKHPKQGMDWGYRLGLGYVPPHDGWDVNLTWTHFNSSSQGCDHEEDCDDCTCECAPNGFLPTYILPCNNCNCAECPIVSDACGKLHVKLDTLDLELGREFFVSKWLTLRPHIGGRAVQIRQNYKVEYRGAVGSGCGAAAGVDIFVPSSASELEFDMHQKFRGIGPRAGLNTSWFFARDWSLYGNMAISALWGSFRLNESAEYESETEVGPCGCESDVCEGFDVKDKYNSLKFVTDLALGLAWDHGFSDDTWFLGFNVGWEHHLYVNQNQFYKFVDDDQTASYVRNQGDLSFAGWTFGARIDF